MSAPGQLLPPLPTDQRRAVSTIAYLTEVGGTTLLLLPFKAPTGPHRGRRYRVGIAGRPAQARVVLNIDGRAALAGELAPAGAGGRSVPVHLRALPTRRPRRVPADLHEALQSHGLVPDQLAANELDQILLMVGESSNRAVRAARIRAVVVAVTARSER